MHVCVHICTCESMQIQPVRCVFNPRNNSINEFKTRANPSQRIYFLTVIINSILIKKIK